MDAGQRCRRWGLLDLEEPVIDVEGPEAPILAEGKAISQGREGLFVEELAALEVAHSEGYVVDHDTPPIEFQRAAERPCQFRNSLTLGVYFRASSLCVTPFLPSKEDQDAPYPHRLSCIGGRDNPPGNQSHGRA